MCGQAFPTWCERGCRRFGHPTRQRGLHGRPPRDAPAVGVAYEVHLQFSADTLVVHTRSESGSVHYGYFLASAMV
jgi:hypothetical protein